MKKIDLERKFLTLKTEVSGATFNENDVRKYVTKNKVEDLIDLIKKAEAALESLKRKEKINDYLSNDGAEKKSEVETLKRIRMQSLRISMQVILSRFLRQLRRYSVVTWLRLILALMYLRLEFPMETDELRG